MSRIRLFLALATGLAALTVALSAAEAAQAPTLALLTDGSGSDDEEDVDLVGASPDARRVFFETRERLAATDTDSRNDVYARNADGSLTHVSDNPSGPDAEQSARLTAASTDGSRLVFATSESLAAADTDSDEDQYRLNADGSLDLLTDGPAGPDAELPAIFESLSADGSRTIFRTSESLAATDTDNSDDDYARNANGSLTHLSDNPTGPDAELGVGQATVSADGTRVIFSTNESLAATDTDTAQDVYARNSDGSLDHLSDDPTGPDAESSAFFTNMSKDGSKVFFTTDESLDAGDINSGFDVYRHDAGGSLVLVSEHTSSANLEGISDDGARAVFTTEDGLVSADGDTAVDLYRRNADGSVDLLTDDPTGPDAEIGALFRGMTSDASRVFFQTTESLAATDTDTADDVYARNANGSLSHLSDTPLGPDAEVEADFDAVSADGSRVFLDTAEPWAAGDTDTERDVYARETDGSLTLLSDNPVGPDIEEQASFERASPDGARVVLSTAESWSASDTDSSEDLYAGTPPSPAGPGPGGGGGPGTTPPPGGGGGGGTRDLVAPALSGVSATRSAFRLGAATTLRFTLSEAARVTVTFQAALPGRRVGRTCRRPARANLRRPRCTRLVTRGSLSVAGKRGPGRLRFTGRLSRTRRLAPGRYRVTLRATDAAGNRSRIRTLNLRILPAR